MIYGSTRAFAMFQVHVKHLYGLQKHVFADYKNVAFSIVCLRQNLQKLYRLFE